jgi:hypothetical protein
MLYCRKAVQNIYKLLVEQCAFHIKNYLQSWATEGKNNSNSLKNSYDGKPTAWISQTKQCCGSEMFKFFSIPDHWIPDLDPGVKKALDSSYQLPVSLIAGSPFFIQIFPCSCARDLADTIYTKNRKIGLIAMPLQICIKKTLYSLLILIQYLPCP